jgi:hypothetical protein
VQSRWAFRGLPTTPRPAKSPLRILQDTTRGGPDELVVLIAYGIADLVHGLRHFIRSVTSNVFAQCGTEHLTARFPSATGEPLDFFEDIIGD